VDRSPSTVVTLVNPDLTIAWVSRSARWITGSDPDSRRGDSAVSRIHPDDAHRLVERLAQLRAAQGHHDYLTTLPEPIRYRFQRFDGTWVVMEATIHNLLGDPEADGLLSPGDAIRLVDGLGRLRAAQGHHACLTTVPEPIRYRFRRFDGTWVVMEATIHTLLGDPEADGLLVFARPVSGHHEGVGHV